MVTADGVERHIRHLIENAHNNFAGAALRQPGEAGTKPLRDVTCDGGAVRKDSKPLDVSRYAVDRPRIGRKNGNTLRTQHIDLRGCCVRPRDDQVRPERQNAFEIQRVRVADDRELRCSRRKI